LMAKSVAQTCNFTDGDCVYGSNRMFSKAQMVTYDYAYTSCTVPKGGYLNNLVAQCTIFLFVKKTDCLGRGSSSVSLGGQAEYAYKGLCRPEQHFFDVVYRWQLRSNSCAKQTLRYCYALPDCVTQQKPSRSEVVIGSKCTESVYPYFPLPLSLVVMPSMPLPKANVSQPICQLTTTSPTSTSSVTSTTTTTSSKTPGTTTTPEPTTTTDSISTWTAATSVPLTTDSDFNAETSPSTSARPLNTNTTSTGTPLKSTTVTHTGTTSEFTTTNKPYIWPLSDKTNCDDPKECSVPLSNGLRLTYARYDCINDMTHLEMPVSHYLNFTITVNTTQLNIGTLESNIVEVYISCYKHRLESNQTCQYESGLHTMMALKDCASAALDSYPVTIVNSTDSTPWPTSPDAVAVIVENDAKMCNYSDAIYQHGAFQTSVAWSDTPLVALFAVRKLNQSLPVPFEAAILAEACNGSLWTVIAPSANVSNTIGEIPFLLMKHTFNRNCSSYSFVRNLVDQIAWDVKKRNYIHSKTHIYGQINDFTDKNRETFDRDNKHRTNVFNEFTFHRHQHDLFGGNDEIRDINNTCGTYDSGIDVDR
ncbi:hypothetical protein AAVH_01327, partial [Aphelenchoides avenae]